MIPRWTRLVGLVLLCVYGAAIGHQMMPHHEGHGDGDSCSLCLLLSSAALPALCVIFLLGTLVDAGILPLPERVLTRPLHQPFSLRGPPFTSV